MEHSRQKRPAVLAPAKINLYLHVTGRREDGYHTLDSMVVFADAGDRVRVGPAPSFSFAVDWPYARAFTAAELDGGENSKNLVVRAARGLAAALQRTPDADVRLTKNLPLASGLGGGSADAAAAIWGLLDLWNVSPQAVPGLDDLLLALGADVPACMECRPVRMGGVGEVIQAVADPGEMPAVLVNPGRHCPTADVFARFRGPFGNPAPEIGSANIFEFLKAQRNDLTPAAIEAVPEIAAVLEALSRREGCLLARMSGSGATCFGLFASEMDSMDAAADIAAAQPQWWVRACVLNRAQRY